MDASARLLVGSIAIIMLMGMFLVSQYAASPTMTTIEVEPGKALVAMDAIRSHGYEVEEAGADSPASRPPSRRRSSPSSTRRGDAAAPPDRQAESTSSGAFMSSSERAPCSGGRIQTAEASIR